MGTRLPTRTRIWPWIALVGGALVSLAPAWSTDPCTSEVDNPPPDGGPKDHQVIHLTSSDGWSFAPVGTPFPRASVPEAITLPDGRVLVYYVSGEAGRHGIHIARLTPAGELERFDCLRLDGAFDGHAVDPDVVLLPDGKIRLFYKADFDQPGSTPSIHSAISEDGIWFTREGPALDLTPAVDPTVARLPDGTWLMAVPAGEVLRLARSPDGRNFSSTGEIVPAGGIPELWVRGQEVHLLAGGGQLTRHVSTDSGRTWTPSSPISIPGLGLGGPSVTGSPGAYHLFAVAPRGSGGSGTPPSTCTPSETTLCLGSGRFRVTAFWNAGGGQAGVAHARALGRDSGYFWFFAPDNAELFVKVLDGCGFNGAYWVFVSGLTDLSIQLTLTDTATGRNWRASTNLRELFPPQIDLRAFPDCP